jgi:hypothetical protein
MQKARGFTDAKQGPIWEEIKSIIESGADQRQGTPARETCEAMAAVEQAVGQGGERVKSRSFRGSARRPFICEEKAEEKDELLCLAMQPEEVLLHG